MQFWATFLQKVMVATNIFLFHTEIAFVFLHKKKHRQKLEKTFFLEAKILLQKGMETELYPFYHNHGSVESYP